MNLEIPIKEYFHCPSCHEGKLIVKYRLKPFIPREEKSFVQYFIGCTRCNAEPFYHDDGYQLWPVFEVKVADPKDL